MFELTGKAAIVTGGASGIGAAIASRLRRAGANVLIADLAAASAAAEGSGCFYRRTDVGDPADVAALCAAAVHFMVSDEASYVTGQTLLVDGGWSTGTSLQAIELAVGTKS
jgi:NAD(P)-dependent dehydrogenase (short-subunit alcohol dehydrogenase family)